jgi:S-adenosylmethionine-diacylglycerol 3-amino-3-carboxypropyl transferase
MNSANPLPRSGTEVAESTAFSEILYAQCWEDADILLEGLDVGPGDTCLSVASAGDNTLALLTRDPRHVIAVDVSPAQLACLELRVAAYRCLSHEELLEFMGSRASHRREELYRRCRPLLDSDATGEFWDQRAREIALYGLGGLGKFERYFRLFQKFVLPLIHSRSTAQELLASKPRAEREAFYDAHWDTWRWRQLIRLFCSQWVMSRLGRDPAFFTYARGEVSNQVLRRVREATTMLDPSQNPYLRWILTGCHGQVLPLSLRPEHFPRIRANLDRLEWHTCSVEDFAKRLRSQGRRVDKFNLSGIFEYMSEDNFQSALRLLTDVSTPGARLFYWNMMVRRTCPVELADRIRCLNDLAAELHHHDKAFFYSRISLEEVR